jgi:hypothetical protein
MYAAVRYLAQRSVSYLTMHIFRIEIWHLTYLDFGKKTRTNKSLLSHY